MGHSHLPSVPGGVKEPQLPQWVSRNQLVSFSRDLRHLLSVGQQKSMAGSVTLECNVYGCWGVVEGFQQHGISLRSPHCLWIPQHGEWVGWRMGTYIVCPWPPWATCNGISRAIERAAACGIPDSKVPVELDCRGVRNLWSWCGVCIDGSLPLVGPPRSIQLGCERPHSLSVLGGGDGTGVGNKELGGNSTSTALSFSCEFSHRWGKLDHGTQHVFTVSTVLFFSLFQSYSMFKLV